MKYLIEGTFEENCLSGQVQIKGAEASDVKDFLISGIPELIQDLFYRLCQNLKNNAIENDLSQDKIISVVSLIAIMCQNTVSENLTKTINQFAGELDSDEDDSNKKDENPWNSLSE